MSRIRLAIAGAITATFVISCGGEDPIAEISKANAAVAAQRSVVESAEKVVATRESEVVDAEKRLAESQGQVQTAELELARLESEVDRDALDTVLFREVQKQLLEDDDLSHVAIVASVADSVVTLSGSVENSKLRDRAIEIAAATEGVKNVQSRIQVSVSAPTPHGD